MKVLSYSYDDGDDDTRSRRVDGTVSGSHNRGEGIEGVGGLYPFTEEMLPDQRGNYGAQGIADIDLSR